MVLLNTEEELREIEKLRLAVFGIENIENTYYLSCLLRDKYKACATIIDDEMAAGCYFHRFKNALVIDQLFVKEEYQETGRRLGRNLVEELLREKENLERLLKGQLLISIVEPLDSKKVHSIYEKMGYKDGTIDSMNMYKTL